jgi:HlyD family secretion protein
MRNGRRYEVKVGMHFSQKRLFIGTILVIAALLVIAYLVNPKGSDGGGGQPKFKEFVVERGTFQVTVSASGVVKPIDRIEIKSKASGQIEDLPVEQGDAVQKGDLIARLDQKDERAAVAQAQADLDIAKAELKQAQRIYDRRNELFEKRLISEEDWNQIELNLTVAKGKLVQVTTTLDRAQERLSESVVRAPIDGVILQKYVEEGQIIASGVSNVGGGTPIVDIADMSSVHIEAGIDEIDIGKVHIGQSALVVAEAYYQMQFKGKVVRIAPEAKIEQNVTLFDVIVEVENTDGKLKSGMNANIEITIVEKSDILLVPAIVLQEPSDTPGPPDERTVLLKKDDEFIPHRVTIGLFSFKQAEILSGLEEGDVLGVPMTSRLKEENEQMEERIRSSRSFGTSSR